MIFSNKIYKISSGKNISLFADNSEYMTIYLFDEKIKKRKVIFSNLIRCINKNTNLEGSFVKQINSNNTCVCQDDNISIINNEEN